MTDPYDGEIQTIAYPASVSVPPGDVTDVEFTALANRVTTLEGAQVASISDLADVSDTPATEGQIYRMTGGVLTPYSLGSIQIVSAFNYVIDGGGAVIGTGPQPPVRIGSACEIIANAVAVGDQVGDISIDIWRDSYANLPPTVADSITGGSPLVISGARSGVNNVATWTTTLAADDFLVFNVQSVTTLTKCTVSLRIKQTVALT